jgi:hypothetical protein
MGEMHSMTKIKVGATVIALILAWIIFAPLANTNLVKTKKEDIREVTIAVDFDPPTRPSSPGEGRQLVELVAIRLTAGPDTWPLEREANSPWIRTVYVAKGKRVSVEVQQHYGVRIGCAISQIGQPIKHKQGFGASRITCEHVVV